MINIELKKTSSILLDLDNLPLETHLDGEICISF